MQLPGERESAHNRALAPLSIPMTFEPNLGQSDEGVQFIGRGKGLTVLLTADTISVQVPQPAPDARGAASGKAGRLMLRVKGAQPLRWTAEQKLRGESNYFLGKDPSKWRTQVPHFERADVEEAVPGVGLAVYGSKDGVEYDLRVAPEADISKLRLAVEGSSDVRIGPDGDLLMRVSGAEIRMKKPRVYQAPRSGWHGSGSKHHHSSRGARRARRYSPRPSRSRKTHSKTSGKKRRKGEAPCTAKIPGNRPCPGKPESPAKAPAASPRREIAGSYVLEADGSIGFRIGPHDPSAALVIDPSLSISYATFLGGSGADAASSIAVDGSGKIYVGGTTGSTSFSSAAPGKFGPADGPTQFFVAKIDPAQTGAASLVYLTFIGGSGFQTGGVIAVDAAGDVAVTGTTTASDYPVTDATTPTSGLSSGLGNDVAISEINATGSVLVFSTLFGGSGIESQNGPGGIAIGPSGSVYVASDVQTTPNNPASPDLRVTSGAYSQTWDGQPGDAFLAVFTPPASSGGAATLKYCTYLGTNAVAPPRIGGVAVDVGGNAYVAGSASNGLTPFPTTNAIQVTYGGGASDAFLMKIAPVGKGTSDLVYATLLGGSKADQALAVALDSANPPNAYVTGTTQSTDFPTTGTGAFQPSLAPNATANAFLSMVAQDGLTGQSKLAYSTYLGGSEWDTGNAVFALSPKAVYVTGATSSFGLPWHDNLQPFSGTLDAFIAKFDTTVPGAGGLIYLTPLGGSSASGAGVSAGNSVAAFTDANQRVHVEVAGSTTSGDFPTALTTQGVLNGFQSQCASCGAAPPLSDAFAAEIVEGQTSAPSVYFNSGQVTFNAAGGADISEPVAILNGGDANLSISGIAISGPNSSDFSVTGTSNCLGRAITPGPNVQCSFNVLFSPSTTGPESAVLLVTDNATGSPQELGIVGNSTTNLATVFPLTLDFGTQAENSASQPMGITLTNVSPQPLNIAIVESGPDQGAFVPVPMGDPKNLQCSGQLPPAGQCVAKYEFTPNASRTFTAQVAFSETGPGVGAQQVVALTGTGVTAAPIASLSQPSLTFGSESVGSTSGSQSVTLTNVGGASLNISQIALAGANAGDFVIVAPVSGTPCKAGATSLAPQGSCAVGVALAPQSTGSKSASLVFTDNAGTGSQQVALSGTGVAAANLQVSPPSLTFTAQSESTSSAPQMLTVTNSGGVSVATGAVIISGPNAADFSAPSGCTAAAGQSCQIGVTFTPAATAPGVRTASLSVPAASPSTISLSGTATQAAITVPTSVNFGAQLAGGSGGSPQPVTVTNSSSGPYAGALTISSVTKTGANAADFVISADSCTGTNAAPGATCTLQVAFKPLQAPTCGANGGTRSATLSVTDNAPGSPHSIPLSGTATSFCVGTAPGQPVQGPVTAGTAASYSLEVDSLSGFTGSAALACAVQPTQTNPPETNYVSGCSITTTPATNPPVVQIAPNTPGQFTLVVSTSSTPIAAVTRFQLPRGLGSRGASPVVALAMLLSAAAFACRRRAGFVRFVQISVLAIGCAMLFAACGGGNSGTPSTPPPPGNFTYTVTVTATLTGAGQPNVQTQLSFPLTVNQPN